MLGPALPGPRHRHLGEAERHGRDDRGVEAELPLVDLAELIAARVIVGPVIGGFLVGDQVGDSLQHEVVVVGPDDRHVHLA